MTLPVRCLEIRSTERSHAEMARIGVDPTGIRIMAPKQFHYNLKLAGLNPAQANIIKQDILSIGGEAAVCKGAVSCSIPSTGAILSGTAKQLGFLVKKLRGQSHGLSVIAESIETAICNAGRTTYDIKGTTRSWPLGERTLVMGVVNVTPDSFSDGGELLDPDSAVKKAFDMADHADWIDVGGESTRPGAEPVDAAEELRRVLPVVERLAMKGVAVSVDTTKSVVARAALDAGAEIINDVSALEADPKMAGVCAEYGCPVILMHMRGTPQTMQEDVEYEDLTGEVFSYLHSRVEYAVAEGIDREKIIIDPGLGFGKSAEGNIELLRNLAEFRSLGRPILVGPSRKSFIGKIIGESDPKGTSRLYGTLAACSVAVTRGAHIIRVHDVKEARAVADVTDALKGV